MNLLALVFVIIIGSLKKEWKSHKLAPAGAAAKVYAQILIHAIVRRKSVRSSDPSFTRRSETSFWLTQFSPPAEVRHKEEKIVNRVLRTLGFDLFELSAEEEASRCTD